MTYIDTVGRESNSSLAEVLELQQGDGITVEMVFDAGRRNAPVRYALDLLSGQGRP